MSRIFYRVHPSDCPPFHATNAWSALWGSTRSEDGSQVECPACDGTSEDLGEPCLDCDDGWIDCVPGYSCCDTAQELIDYFTERSEPTADDAVIVFEGRQVDTGFDGEPTAVPHHVIETLTWDQFTARHSVAA